MKKIAFFSVILSCFAVTLNAAPVAGTQRRGQSTVVSTQPSTATTATAARAATTRAAVGRSAAVPTTTNTAVSARSGAVPRTTAARSSATSSATTISARAAAQQKVVATGTSIAAARENSVVNPVCREKFEGCMDSFCMLDNASGGRCICSDRNAELDSILQEIENLDAQSYKMATEGVERLEMGADAEAAMAAAQAAANALASNSTNSSTRGQASTKRTLDLSLWDQDYVSFEEMDIFSNNAIDPIEGKTGDALYRAAADICKAQIPECANDMTMLQMMYTQQIKSNCSAYENDLKKRKTASSNKLAAAEKALRETALDQLRIANKYDLGQCTLEFKKCMQTTAGCGTDFKGCVGIAAAENAQKGSSTKSAMKMFHIKGENTQISVAASTMDALESKRPICESVTNSCVNVKGQVWDTFVREVAPQLKSAELLAESDLRQNCIGNISSCIQKACRDTIDPKDPEGSYDMCLSRPETVESLCRVQVEPCKNAEPMIMDFVYAKLAAMRVDSCTTAVKECLTSEDRCGSDYTQCVGLDTDTIVRMCPTDKLVACQYVSSAEGARQVRSEEEIFNELSTMVQGIMLNIDNNMLELCQQAANEAMVNVCGSNTECNGLAVDEGIGSRSLDYKICEYTNDANNMDINYAACRTDISQIRDEELGRVVGAASAGLGPVTPFAGVLGGTIYWNAVDYDENGKLTGIDEYINGLDSQMTKEQRDKVTSELSSLQRSINVAISAIEADPTVQFCMTGRQVQGMKDNMIGREGKARFPGLTKQMRLLIAESAVKIAKGNYNKKYDELNNKMLQDYAKIGERMAEIQGENALDARREIARVACVNMAEASILPMSPNPPKGAFGKVMAIAAIAGAAVAIPFTGGLSMTVVSAAAGGVTATAATVSTGAIIAGAALGVAGIGLSANAGSGSANGPNGGINRELVGSRQLNQWNYKETITSTFEWDTLKCHKCVRSQTCGKTRRPWIGNKYCQNWNEETENCSDIQF